MKIDREKIALAGSVLSFLGFVFVARAGGISASSAVGMQLSLVLSFLSSGPLDMISPFMWLALSLVLLALSFSFLCFFGYKSADRRVGLIAGTVNALVCICIFQTIFSVFIGAAVLIASTFIVPLSNTYSKELKRWIMFRTGSNSASRAMLIFNLFVAIGLVVTVTMSVDSYRADFRADMKQALIGAIGTPDVPGIPNELIDSQIDSQIESALDSPFFASYFRWLPIVSGVGAFFVLEFLRNLLFSMAAGIFTFILLKSAR